MGANQGSGGSFANDGVSVGRSIWVKSDKDLSTGSPIVIPGRDSFFVFIIDKMSFVDFNNKSLVVIDGNGTLARKSSTMSVSRTACVDGKKHFTIFVIPGQVMKFPFAIALTNVETGGKPAHA